MADGHPRGVHRRNRDTEEVRLAQTRRFQTRRIFGDYARSAPCALARVRSGVGGVRWGRGRGRRVGRGRGVGQSAGAPVPAGDARAQRVTDVRTELTVACRVLVREAAVRADAASMALVGSISSPLPELARWVYL